MSKSVTGQVVLITGAARGIGAETARVLARRGARLSLVGMEPDRLRALADELNAAGSTPGPAHVWFEADVTDQAAIDAAVAKTVEALGGIDAVVANAGVSNLGTVALGAPDALVRTIDVNLNGVVRTVSAALPHVIERKGYVLVVASLASFTVLPGMAAYCASKAGAEAFANVLRLEVAHRGVKVGSAHPGWIDTDLVRDIEADLGSFKATRSDLPGPLGATTSVEECATAFADGIARRKRRVYVPRSVGVVQALRTLVIGPIADKVIGRQARTLVPRMEDEVRALGRSFSQTTVGMGGHEQVTVDQADARRAASVKR
ncbi:MAG: SDR family oxidoreductase [Patulibacter sp.]|nr:SDR family oxidoreductase [Patulibacter sp.]